MKSHVLCVTIHLWSRYIAGTYSEDAFPETISLIDFGVDVFKSWRVERVMAVKQREIKLKV